MSQAIWTGVALLLLAATLVVFMRPIQARRAGLALIAPLATAAGLRVATAVVIAAVPGLNGARPIDDRFAYPLAKRLIDDPETFGAVPGAIVSHLQLWLLAGQTAVIGRAAGDFPLRITQIAITVMAIGVVAVAVNDLAHPRAGVLVAWLLALEPAGVFLSGFLLKEPLVMLGEAFLILGCVRMYERRDAPSVAWMAAGLALAGVIRPYLLLGGGAACVLVLIHSALRHPAGRARSLTLGLAVVAVAVGTAVAVARGDRIVDELQFSQDANTHDAANLKLEPVDLTTVGGAAEAVPRRIFDLWFRPYPWQTASLSERLGVIGTLYAWALLFLALFLVLRRPRESFPKVAPLVYVAICLTVTYAVSTGNAGTGFRYRTHLLMAVAACVSVLAPRIDRVRLPSLGVRR